MPDTVIDAGAAIEKRPSTPGDVMTLIRDTMLMEGTPQEKALVIRELVALQQSVERFAWEREERQAKIDFDNALNACQAQIGRIAPNQKRENNIWWADYAQIDRAVRPIYVEAGFAIAFSEEPAEKSGRLRMRATLSRGGISKDYFADISIAPANAKMSEIDANAAAASRVKRYLMLDIFNIAIGIDKVEKQGIPAEELEAMSEETVQEWLDAMNQAPDLADLKSVFATCWAKAKALRDNQAKAAFQKAYEDRKRRLA